MTDQEIRLKFGEMNAGEMRLARALVGWHEREIAKLKDTLPERPQAAEIAKLKAEREKWEADALRYCKNADFWRSEHDKAQGILKACLSAMPFGNIETHTVENLPHRIADLASEIASLSLENERLEAELAALRQSTQSAQPLLADDGRSLEQVAIQEHEKAPLGIKWFAAANAVAAVAIIRAVQRIEAVTEKELQNQYWKGQTYVGTSQAIERIRARLIAAVKGEGQPVVVNEPPKDEKQPNLSGESEKQDEPATKEAPATFQAHGKTWTRHTPGDPMPCDGEAWVNWLLESEFNGSFPYRNNSTLARNLGKFWTGIIGWRYADEPAQAQPTTSPGWTPAVGDVVLAQAVRRMEAVPVEELCDAYEAANTSYGGMGAVRARLILAFKGEGQPVVVNEPPHGEKQPGLSGESESQTEEPAWIPHDGGPCLLKDEEVDEWQIEWNDGDFDTYKRLKPSEADGWKNGITSYRVLKWKPGFGPEAKANPAQAQQAEAQPWTPAVGDTVRLKSGGPSMTVTGVDPLSLMCAWMNADDELQVEPITTLCLEPAQP